MAEKNAKPTVAVLAGGISSERDVSLRSGRAVAEALAKMSYPVELVDVVSTDIPELDKPFDVFFVALHGGFGEDGALQAMMDDRGLCYTGCGAQSSRTCMDKIAAKQALRSARIATPDFVLVDAAGSDGEILSATEPLGLPVAIKPRAEGSSVGVSIVRDAASIVKGVRETGDGEALVEEFIDGAELHVGILGEAPLPLIEVRPEREFYDYEAKYGQSDTRYINDVDLPGDIYDLVQESGLAAFRALGCRDFARVDILLAEGRRPVVLEVNTIPGFTERSLLPMAAARAGIAFPLLCEKIIKFALTRRATPAGK